MSVKFSHRFILSGVVSLLLSVTSEAGLTGLWKFDGHHLDSIGTHNGTFYGTETYTNGYFGQALALNGASYVNLGSSVLSTAAYTKAAWIYRIGGANNNIISGDSSANQHAFYAPSGLSYMLCAGHNGAWTTVKDNVAISNAVWTHVAVTYDQAENGGTLRIYRNGRPCGGTSVATNVVPPNGGACFIGAHNSGSQFTGFIDEAAVWDRALSAKEVENLYRASQHAVSLPAATNWHDRVYDLVPEMADYDVVYEYPIPNSSALGSTGKASYLWDNSGIYTNISLFDRVAYYLEVATNGAVTSQWVCVSVDAFTRDAKKLGIPSIATGAQFQQYLANMNVYAGGSYVTTGTNIQTGNIEFWGYNYSWVNAIGVPGASGSDCDFGDQNSGSGNYGSMQIHNYGAKETIFAYNRWGAGGTSDLGVGDSPTGHPDWTFAYNATNYTSKVMLVLVRPAVMPEVTLFAFPKPMQLYPRDLTGFASVTVSGAVTSVGCSHVSVAVNGNGAPYTNIVQTLSYANGQAPFTFNVPILAGLTSYDFTVRVTYQGTSADVATVSDVVAGDVFLINGQSNAEARMFNGSANANQTTWVRSYGRRDSSGAAVRGDTSWHLAEGDVQHGPGAVGQWGLRLGWKLVEATGIPVCIINNAEGGQAIAYFQRNDNDPPNSANNNYGQVLYRVQQAGLQNAVRAILWYQGESDYTDPAGHEAGWLRLYQGWRMDYPSLEKIYVCQLHAACGQYTYTTADLRNRQRRFGDRDPAIEVMSETAVLQNTDLCHYAYAGYEMIGNNLARMVGRDLYGISGLDIDPPNPAYAYRSGSNREIRIEMRNTADTLSWDAGAHADFRLTGSSATPTNGYATAHTIVLQFNQDVSAATAISYVSHWSILAGGGIVQPGPYVKNANGVGLLVFQIPILAADPGGSPAAPFSVKTIPVSANRLDIAWGTQTSAVVYLVRRDGVIIGTTSADHYIDYDVQPGQTYFYQVAAVGNVSTSGWSTVISGSTVAHNVFSLVPESNDYSILYQLDLGSDFAVSTNLDVSYNIDNSSSLASGIKRVAYYLELQEQPGTSLYWVYASMNTFTNKATLLGVPVSSKGATFQRYVQDLNVFASATSGIVTGRHIATGNIEFWGNSYSASNAAAIPGAGNTYYDFGDQIGSAGGHGSMQLHNYAAAQTVFAYNNYSAAGLDAVGIGNCTFTNADWTFAANAPLWNVRRLYVLVQTDANINGLPDVWENAQFGSLINPQGGPDDDPDGDGQSNYKEWIAGTNPNDAKSFLRLETPQPSGNNLTITFPTVAGKTYAVEYKNDLTDAEWTPLTTVNGTGDNVQVTDTGAGLLSKRFYHLRIVL